MQDGSFLPKNRLHKTFYTLERAAADRPDHWLSDSERDLHLFLDAARQDERPIVGRFIACDHD
jgi:hypothetical protein